MKDSVREALVGAIHEVAASSDKRVFADLIEVIKNIRDEYIITYMTDEYVRQHIWPMIRKDTDLTMALLNATANFTLAIDNLDEAIAEFSNKVVSFTSASIIVDDDLMKKSSSQTELKKTLTNNHWLFFILFATLHLYLVNSAALDYVVA